jgi:hypothetical protein
MEIGDLKMNDFNSLSKTELRAYVLSHRQDEQAWDVYMERLKDDPTVIRIPPNLNKAGWTRVEQLIKSHAQGAHS